MSRTRLAVLLAVVPLACAAPPARALVYLADKSLEACIVRCPVAVVGKVKSVTGKRGTLTLEISRALKGDLSGDVTVAGNVLRSEPLKLKLNEGDRALVFLFPDASGGHRMEARLPLRTDAEEKTAIACYEAVAPHAEVLASLADARREIDAEKLRPAITQLADSPNAFVQILMGRLMAGPLAARVDPAPYTAQIAAGLKSPHAEYVRGAAAWAAVSKDAALLPPLRNLLTHKDAGVREAARRALAQISPESRPAS